MNTYKNIHFTKRSYEFSQVVACVSDECPSEHYVLDNNFDVSNLTHVYTQNGVRYYGYM